MVTFNPNWSSYSATSIAASSITNTNTATTAAINLDNLSACEVAVTIAYGNPADEGIKVYVLRECESGVWEEVASNPWGFMMPYGTSVTRRRSFSVAASMVSNFKIHLTNNSGATVTATVSYKTATIDQT